MSLSDSDARERLDATQERLADIQNHIEEGRIDRDEPEVLYTIARTNERIAECLAILDRTDESRSRFQTAAETFLECIEAFETRDDEDDIRTLPVKITIALHCAFVAQAEDIATTLANKSVALSEEEMTTFSLGSKPTAKEAFRTLTSQLWAAVYLNDPLAHEILDEYRKAARAENERFLLPMADIFEGFVTYDEEKVRDGIQRRISLHEERFADGYDSVHDAVAMTEAAFVHLAARKGIDVSVNSEFLPPVLLPDGEQSDASRDPLASVFIDWDEETGDLILEHVMSFEADREVTVDDIPEDRFGSVLSDAWLGELREAVLENPTGVAPDVREGLQSETVIRRLVIRTPKSHSHLFDESFRDSPIDKIDFHRV